MTTKSAPFHLVLCCGMIRSGSTLQYQIAAALLDIGYRVQRGGFIQPGQPPDLTPNADGDIVIYKLHHWEPKLAELLRNGQARALYSFRDIPDVAHSAMRQFKLPFREIWDGRWLQSSVEAGDLWLAEPNVYSAKYELFNENLELETRRIARHLGITADDNEITRIARDHNRFAQCKRLKNLQLLPGRDFCEETLLHPGHLSTKGNSTASTKLKARERELLHDEFFEWRKTRGYVRATATPVEVNPVQTQIYVPHIGWLKHGPADEVAHFLRQGLYEPDLQAFLWLYLRPGMRMLDIGAHFGLYSRLASVLIAKTGHVVAVEPNPESRELLQSNLGQSENVSISSLGLSDSPGVLNLRFEGEGLSSHGYVSDSPGGITIKTSTINALVESLHWPSVDFVKIDTEGHEFQVLDGASKILQQTQPLVIGIEFSEANLLRTGRSTHQLADALVGLGFTLCSFDLVSLRLKRYEGSWPIWYKNLFAVRNLAVANTTLADALGENLQVARDIASRHEACKSFKTYTESGDQTNIARTNHELEQWARQAEERFRREKQRADEATIWATEAEKRAVATKKLAADNEAWARKSDAELAVQTKNLVELQTWAKKAEKLLRFERKRVDEVTIWAKEAEKRAVATKKLATDNEAWARKSDAELAVQTKNLVELQTWAKKAEELLRFERKRVDEVTIWATEAEKRAAATKKLAADYEAWARKSDAAVVVAKATIRELEKHLHDHREWALRSEAELNSFKAKWKNLPK